MNVTEAYKLRNHLHDRASSFIHSDNIPSSVSQGFDECRDAIERLQGFNKSERMKYWKACDIIEENEAQLRDYYARRNDPAYYQGHACDDC